MVIVSAQLHSCISIIMGHSTPDPIRLERRVHPGHKRKRAVCININGVLFKLQRIKGPAGYVKIPFCIRFKPVVECEKSSMRV